jgi:acetyl esterase/lipase
MRFLGLGVMVMMGVVMSARGDEAPIPLWEKGAPGALGTAAKDVPTLTLFLPAEGTATGAAIVICPGGGYMHLADHEGKDYALFLSARGVTCFVLKYRLGPDYHHPSMMLDGLRAMRYVRANAEKWKIDPKRIGMMGSSAGGHMTATVMTHFDDGDAKAEDPIDRVSSRPDFGILCYAVISMGDIAHQGSKKALLGENPSDDLVKLMSDELQVTEKTPPCFIWAGADDKTVPVENSLRFADACAEKKVPFELHIYEHARHGLGLGDKAPFEHALPWTGDLMRWLGTWNKK